MENLIIPKDYHSELNLHDTQIAIKTVKVSFKISYPCSKPDSCICSAFCRPTSGLNE